MTDNDVEKLVNQYLLDNAKDIIDEVRLRALFDVDPKTHEPWQGDKELLMINFERLIKLADPDPNPATEEKQDIMIAMQKEHNAQVIELLKNIKGNTDYIA